MAKGIVSVFNKFLSIFILLLHLGCFIFTAKNHYHHQQQQQQTKKRKVSSLSPSRLKPHKAISFSWSYLKCIFSSKSYKTSNSSSQAESPVPTLTSARSSQHSLVSMIVPLEHHQDHDNIDPPSQKPSGSCQESDISTTNDNFFPLRNDIFPCTACGEIFQKLQLLEQHQAIKHALSELQDGDSGKNIVHIIFKTGWSCKEKNPEIHRILKIHNCPKVLSRFEEYREVVKAKAARNGTVKRRDERCIADGNELLRFYCSTFICDLGVNGNSSICNQQYCSVCGIIKSGFSPKMDGISTLSTSLRAHVAIPEDIEEEFRFMNVKRAMLVCRVIAGRIGCDLEEENIIDKEDGGFDCILGRGGSWVHNRLDEEELIVFNPRAVLPCFVIVYTV